MAYPLPKGKPLGTSPELHYEHRAIRVLDCRLEWIQIYQL
jgi:hypothetical protein